MVIELSERITGAVLLQVVMLHEQVAVAEALSHEK